MSQQNATVHPINQSVNVNQQTSQPTTPKLPNNKPTQSLPSRKLSFERHLNLLRAYATAYAHHGRAVGVKEVSEISNISPDTISTANAFFLDLGIIQKNDAKFIPSAELQAFNHAFQWNPESAPAKLASLIQNSWFAKRLLPKLLMSNLTEDEAITELASFCSAPPSYKGNIRTLLDFLNEVGLIKRQNDLIMKGNIAPSNSAPETTAAEQVEKPPVPIQPTLIEPVKEQQRNTVPPLNQMSGGTVQFNISVKVDIAEFAGWDAEKISSFFNGIAQVLAAKAAAEQAAK